MPTLEENLFSLVTYGDSQLNNYGQHIDQKSFLLIKNKYVIRYQEMPQRLKHWPCELKAWNSIPCVATDAEGKESY